MIYINGKVQLLPVIFFFAFYFGILSNSGAQDYEGWFDYNPYYKLTENTRLFGETGFRTQLKNVASRQFIISLNASHKLINWLEFLGGVRFFHTDFNVGLITNEVRPWIGGKVSFSGPLNMQIKNYLRSEYRFVRITGYQTEKSFRFRNQFGITVPISRNAIIDNTLYGILDVEVFANTKKGLLETFADQMRIRLGIGYRWTKLWRFELIYSAQKAGEGEFEVDDHIFRFQAKHYLN